MLLDSHNNNSDVLSGSCWYYCDSKSVNNTFNYHILFYKPLWKCEVYQGNSCAAHGQRLERWAWKLQVPISPNFGQRLASIQRNCRWPHARPNMRSHDIEIPMSMWTWRHDKTRLVDQSTLQNLWSLPHSCSCKLFGTFRFNIHLPRLLGMSVLLRNIFCVSRDVVRNLL